MVERTLMTVCIPVGHADYLPALASYIGQAFLSTNDTPVVPLLRPTNYGFVVFVYLVCLRFFVAYCIFGNHALYCNDAQTFSILTI